MPKAPRQPAGQNKPIHPNSRFASHMNKKAHHVARVQRSKADTKSKVDHLMDKLIWFQENMDCQKITYTKSELAELTQVFMQRFKDELEQISIIGSVGCRKSNQHVARESAIQLTQDKEKQEFEGNGIEVPDLVNGKNLRTFVNWTGEASYLPNIKLRKVSVRDVTSCAEVKCTDIETDDSTAT